MIEQTLQAIEQVVLDFLHDNPAGVSEFLLLKYLRAEQLQGFDDLDFKQPSSLYQSHFLLFHLLYRLQQRLAPADYLLITPVKIQLQVNGAKAVNALSDERGQNVVINDKQAAFYLCQANLHKFTAAEVKRLMQQGYAVLAGNLTTSNPEVDAALATLKVSLRCSLPFDQQNWRVIKQAYVQAIRSSHPDRGGHHEHALAINQAYDQLKRYRQIT